MKKLWIALVAVLILPLSTLLTACTPKLKGIVLDTSDVKLEYVVGEEVSLVGLKVNARFSDQSKEAVESDQFEVDTSAVKTNEVGTYKVVVTYKGHKASFDVVYYGIGTMRVVGNNKIGIGQTLEEANILLEYTSGKGEVMPANGFTVEEFDNQSTGVKTVTINYLGYQFEIEIEVIDEDSYLTYVKEKLEQNKGNMSLNNFTKAMPNDEYYFIGNYSSYVRKDGKEYWIEDNFVYTKDGETYTSAECADRKSALESVLTLDFTFPFEEGEYNRLLTYVLEKLDGEGEISYQNEGTNLTITLVNGEETFKVVVDLEDFTIVKIEEGTGEAVTVTTLNDAKTYEDRDATKWEQAE